MHKFIQYSVGALALTFLAACGGGGGSSDPTSGTGGTGGTGGNGGGGSNVEEVSGTVADGYIQGATVCLDVNGNKACDAGEPTAITGAGGAYRIADVTAGDVDLYPIVVEVPATAYDEDDPLGTTVGKKYVLSAPPGKPEFVSPLTTMVHTQLESNPTLTVDDAEGEVKGRLGYSSDSTVSLFQDYVAGKAGTDDDADDYARLHQVAQVTAQILENNIESIEAAAGEAGLDTADVFDELIAIIVKEVISQLSEIVSQVDEAGESFDKETLAIATVGDLDTSDLEDKVVKEEVAASFEATSLLSILQGGINWLWSEPSREFGDPSGQTVVEPARYEYGRISIDSTGTTLTEAFYEYEGSEFVQRTETHADIVLTSSGWVELSDNVASMSITFNADNSATITHESGAWSENVTGSSVDVSGKFLRTFLSDHNSHGFGQAVPGTAVFSDGSKAYQWSFKLANDLYEIGKWEGDGETCDGQNLASAYGDNCNTTWGYKQDGPATTLAELVFPSNHDFSQSFNNYMYLGDGFGVQFVGDSTAASGTTRFVYDDFSSGEFPTQMLITSGVWTKLTANGATLLLFDVPPELKEKMWDDDKATKFFVAVQNGFVRRGEYHKAGSIDVEDEWNFNDVAMGDILSNFNP